jgi:hypothetical protein
MRVAYEGWPGTGLRLEDENDVRRCVDAGGSHGGKGGMTLYVGERAGHAQVELDPGDVARLAVMCAQWLAWHHSGRGTR